MYGYYKSFKRTLDFGDTLPVVCICMYVFWSVYVRTYVCIFMIHVCVCMKIISRLNAISDSARSSSWAVYVCMYVCMYVYKYVCMYACMYAETYIHTCTHAYILTR
jgi:hypothetical protein